MTQEKIVWWRVALVVGIVAAIVIGGVWWWQSRGGPSGTAGENVAFEYRASFSYFGSADNRPLENLYLWFPLPQVENQLAGNLICNWALYYIENDNTFTLQATPYKVENLRGARTSTLGILYYGVGMGKGGPTASWILNRLYPHELFIEIDVLSVDNKKASSTTARLYGEPDPNASWLVSENRVIDLSFTASLFRENVQIEAWQWHQENGPPGAYWLWPVT